jgi:transcriptional regulator with XRE-family HTH domain
MASTRGGRLRAARQRRGFKSAREAAKALGISISTYGAHERAEAAGGRGYNPNQARFYARRFGVSPEWLLTGRGQGPQDEFAGTPTSPAREELPKIPVIGYVGNGGEVHGYAVAKGELDQVEQPRSMPSTAVAVEIRGDVLGAHFNRWLVFFDSVHRPVQPGFLGELCAVGLPDGRTMIKQLRRGPSEGLYNLAAPGASITATKVEWAARIDTMAWRPR